MYKKTIWHVVLAAYVVFIFSNSLTPADLSSEESGFVMRLVHQAIGAAGLSAPWLTEHVIRKYAHFSEYTLLGILLFQSMRNLDCGAAFRRQLHMLLIFFIPFVDETLQLFTEGRSGQISDVWLDMSGAAAGMAITVGVLCCLRRKKERARQGGRE